ncbi:protein MAIN-LIKE 1-like [Glycine max]|uniref:protein MAIN-LIKE 1-like n=1 Tax=Glycine max TaxID=3847 RepID=UPI0003DECC17|nr:protein MAIN-LIKE 1-like [Glycine max]|eukprot:XP_006575834.1 protein MAIN-LIKE 1-like [Glycine max]
MRKKCGRFFRGFLRNKILQDLPRDPTKEGRALGAGRGRGISEDAHEADVPRCRRPTASARRQWVRLREDVTERPEDVAQLHEDVPHVSDATPEMIGLVDAVQTEGVATNGSLGSPAADEGFPDGPRDPLTLLSMSHTASGVDRYIERPNLKLVSHSRKVDKIGRPTPEIERLIAGTGLSPLIRCSVITTDPGLISAFVERWHRETSTFHLPVGELAITLDDVAPLLHIPITGALHTFEPLITSDAIGLLTELLEVSHEEATFETQQAGGPHVRLGWLRHLYESQCRAGRWVVAACMYLLHLVGCTLFTNKSSTHVHVVHLEAFRDLAQAGGFIWGVATLVHMYEHLNDASQASTRQLGGYITLLQCWIYEHFPTMHTSVVHDAYDEGSPRACKWLTGKAHMTGIKGAPYRRRLDALTVTDVCWMPYGEHRGVRGFDLISSYTGQLRWGQIVVYVRPERVLRQFGYLQTVPPPPVCDSLTGDDIDDQWLHFSDHLLPSGELCVVPGQVAPDYMEWFFRISHPFFTRTEETAASRHA